jgi:hypothetical protein
MKTFKSVFTLVFGVLCANSGYAEAFTVPPLVPGVTIDVVGNRDPNGFTGFDTSLKMHTLTFRGVNSAGQCVFADSRVSEVIDNHVMLCVRNQDGSYRLGPRTKLGTFVFAPSGQFPSLDADGTRQTKKLQSYTTNTGKFEISCSTEAVKNGVYEMSCSRRRETSGSDLTIEYVIHLQTGIIMKALYYWNEGNTSKFGKEEVVAIRSGSTSIPVAVPK